MMKNNAEQVYLEHKARIYILRCIVKCDCLLQIVKNNYFDFGELLRFLSANPRHKFHNDSKQKSSSTQESEQESQDENLQKLLKQTMRSCKNTLKLAESMDRDCKLGTHKTLQKNLSLLQNTLNLKPAEVLLIEFLVIKDRVMILDDMLGIFGDISQARRTYMVSKILDTSLKNTTMILNNNSTLIKLGIIDKVDGFYRGFRMLCFRDSGFSDILTSCDKNSFVNYFAMPCNKSHLLPRDYAHIKEFSAVQSYLKSAIKQKGVNILLYGKPGTGKSEFAKLLAQSIKAKAHTLKSTNIDGEAQDGESRLHLYLLAQKVLDFGRNILLYDEAEDIFSYSNLESRTKNKAFLNDSLESNPVPTIWITNNIKSVDDAIIRRFCFVIKIKMPTNTAREQIVKRICGDRLNEEAFEFAKNTKNLSPATIQKAFNVSLAIASNKPSKWDFSSNFTMLIKNTLKAQKAKKFMLGKPKKSKSKQTVLPKSYSTDFINADCDISNVANGLGENPNARICLYGLSGTGKSAFAQFIAKSLKRPCIIKAVSDLESAWVGEAEKNIARAFKEAKDKKAVLIFDEVDSFLRDRRLAVQGFEATKVNEMLLQMEKFNGIFVATTNLMDNIDKAALRRFDLKVEFKALNPAQRANLFKKECALLGLKCESRAKESVERLECLTPGDFAAVKRQNKFSPIKNAMDFYARLCEEVKVKDLRESGANTGVGFLR